MKRFTAAALAAATAVSLAAAPAQAANDEQLYLRGLDKPGGSSQVTDREVAGYIIAGGVVEAAKDEGLTNNKGLTSSVRSMVENNSKEANEAAGNALGSSFKNDAQNGYPVGTTFEILLGTGIAALVLALVGGAASQGLINLPF